MIVHSYVERVVNYIKKLFYQRTCKIAAEKKSSKLTLIFAGLFTNCRVIFPVIKFWFLFHFEILIYVDLL